MLFFSLIIFIIVPVTCYQKGLDKTNFQTYLTYSDLTLRFLTFILIFNNIIFKCVFRKFLYNFITEIAQLNYLDHLTYIHTYI